MNLKKFQCLLVIPWLGIIAAVAVTGAAVSVAHTAIVLNEEKEETEEVATYGDTTNFPNLAGE